MSPTDRKPRRRAVVVVADAQQPQERDQIAELLQQYGATGIKAKLNRLDPKTRRPAYLETLEPLNPDTLQEDTREKYGGGDYRAYIYVNGEYQPGKYIEFSIAGKPKDESDDILAKIDKRLTTPAAAAAAPQSGLTMLKDIIAIVTPLAAAAGGLLIPLLTRKDGSSAVELLTLTQQAEERGERRGVELGKLKAGAMNGDGGMLEVANRFIPPILQLAASRRAEQAPHANPPAPAAAAAAEPMPTPQATLAPGDPANRPEYAWLSTVRPFLPHLVGQAAIGANPGVVMEFALSQLPAAVLQQLERSVILPDFETVMRGELRQHLPKHEAWADEFLSELIEFADPSQDGDETDEPPPPAAPVVAKKGRKTK